MMKLALIQTVAEDYQDMDPVRLALNGPRNQCYQSLGCAANSDNHQIASIY